MPGWVLETPSVNELAEIRRFVLARSRADDIHAPFLLAKECDTFVCVIDGSATIYRDDADEGFLERNGTFFAARGASWSVLALEHPTVLLCVSYREVTTNAAERGSPVGTGG